jgi:hypothetical protein
MRRLLIALTMINLVLLLVVLAQTGRTTAQQVAQTIRARAFELVDDRGHVRARLHVESDREVVLRLLDAKGTIRVKLGAGADGSGLLLLDEATEPAVHIIARRTGTSGRPVTTSLTLRGAGGRQRAIRP